jgi:hypothetical protein
MRSTFGAALALGAFAVVQPAPQPHSVHQQDTTRVAQDSLRRRTEARLRTLQARVDALRRGSLLCPMPVAPADTASAVSMPRVRPDSMATIPMPTQRRMCFNPLFRP